MTRVLIGCWISIRYAVAFIVLFAKLYYQANRYVFRQYKLTIRSGQ